MGVLGKPGCGRIAAAMVWLGVAIAAPQGRADDVAALPSAPEMSLGGDDDQPTTAWTEFCGRLPAECLIDPDEPEILTLTPATWSLLTSLNLRVNETITPMTDLEHSGVGDRWDYPDDGKGDCEDIQLLKRRLLAQAGLPRRAMRMTVVVDSKDAGHAVLTVRTDRGDLILDNESDTVLPWNRTGYEFIKREGSDGPAWVALGGARTRIVVASRSATHIPVLARAAHRKSPPAR